MDKRVVLEWGSSPHMRGARCAVAPDTEASSDHPRRRGEHLARLRLFPPDVGIIPAYAGSTTWS